ncbi:MAG TPA: hypothetical protein VD966_00230 [Pyrinomonadaceae bacterium]|nr:hypothetical protein [Pyrinomonadaceae bacterium]
MLFVKTQDHAGHEHYINLAQVTQMKILRGGKWKYLLEVHLSDGSRKTFTGEGAQALLTNLEASGFVVEPSECAVAI